MQNSFKSQHEAFAKLSEKLQHREPTSFPRRRESIFEHDKLLNKISFLNFKMDSRLHGNDGRLGFYWWCMRFGKGLSLSYSAEFHRI
ncbi:hypothetical protein CGZ65_10425 [Neisseria weixii]|nr:hypothetical protein CGZ65_10425 [Neisseria weixii]